MAKWFQSTGWHDAIFTQVVCSFTRRTCMSNPVTRSSISPKRARLQFNELLDRWDWTQNDLIDAILSGHLTPSIYEKGQLWPQGSRVANNPLMSPATIYVNDWMYLVGVDPTGPYDCSFRFLAKEGGNLQHDAARYSRDSSGFVKYQNSLAEVIECGSFSMTEILRLEANGSAILSEQAISGASPNPKPLATIERKTLLAIIAVLCKEAGLDYKTSAKTAGLIKNSADLMGIDIGETTIEDHLKRIPDALETRMK